MNIYFHNIMYIMKKQFNHRRKTRKRGRNPDPDPYKTLGIENTSFCSGEKTI